MINNFNVPACHIIMQPSKNDKILSFFLLKIRVKVDIFHKKRKLSPNKYQFFPTSEAIAFPTTVVGFRFKILLTKQLHTPKRNCPCPRDKKGRVITPSPSIFYYKL